MKRCALYMIILVLLPSVLKCDPLPMPCDEVWRLELNSNNICLGQVWNVDGAIHQLIGVDRQLVELSDGRIVTTSDTLNGRITAIERADVNEADGIEVLVSTLNDSLNSLLILDGMQFDIITEFPIGSIWHRLINPEDSLWSEYEYWYERTADLKWLGGEDSTLLVFRVTDSGWEAEFVRDGLRNGSISKINIRGEQVGGSIICGAPATRHWRDDESGESGYLVIGTRIDGFYPDISSSEETTFLASTLNENGELQSQRQITSLHSEWDMTEIHPTISLSSFAVVPMPGGGIGGVECIVLDSSNWEDGRREPQASLYIRNVDQLEPIEVYDLGNRWVGSMVYLSPEENFEGRANLLCTGTDGSIRLFDLTDFRMNGQEYRWLQGARPILGDDFDGDGRTELIGLQRNILTCARMRTLDAPDSPTPPVIFNLYLSPAYPNPFNSTTTVEYALPFASAVTLNLYNLSGQRVETLVSGRIQAGNHRKMLDAGDLASGLYFVKLEGSGQTFARKVMLLK